MLTPEQRAEEIAAKLFDPTVWVGRGMGAKLIAKCITEAVADATEAAEARVQAEAVANHRADKVEELLTGVVDRRDARIVELEAWLVRLQRDWLGNCNICARSSTYGCAPDCKLDAALKATATEVGE